MWTVFWFFLLAFSKARGVSDVLKSTQPLYGISTFAETVENKSLCYDQLVSLRVAVDEGEVWAIKAMDSSGRPESGFIYGNNLWIGSRSQCKDISNTKPLEVNRAKIKQLNTSHDYPPYSMGFTMVHLKHNTTLQFHTGQILEWTVQLGLCLPKSCNKDEILHLAQMYFGGNNLEVQNLYDINFEVIDVRQLIEDDFWILKLPKTIIFCTIFFVILLLTIIGTTYDIRRHNLEKNILTGHNASCNGKSGSLATMELVSKSSLEELSEQSTFSEIIRCFSFCSNTKLLVKTKLSTDSVGCIHGLRFFSMLWVVALHAIFFQADYMRNVPYAFRLSEDILAEVLSNGTYSVDSYLFLSGFLVTYLYYYKLENQDEESSKPINYSAKVKEFVMMWINRFCRLTPSYVVVLLFTNTLYTFYREKSSVTSSERLDILCDKYWWRNLLYINNLFPRKEMCMSWSWYLSIDMQFFSITSVLLILSTVAFKASAVIVVLLVLIAVVTTSWTSYTIGYIPTMDEQLAQLDAIYDLPWNRIGPYLIGVITAYILAVKMKNKLELSEKMRIFLWVVFPLLNLWILFTLHTRQLSVEFSAVYMGISRTLWGVGIAWVLVACCTGNARTLNKLLSFRGFIPLSRLTYCAYLLNPVVANMIYLSSESGINASLADLVITVCGVTLITFYMAYVLSVMVESPFILLTKMAFKRRSDASKNAQTDLRR